jgi:hypothetical protein
MITVIETDKMGHVARFKSEDFEGRDYSEEPSPNWRIILKEILEKINVKLWIGFSWLQWWDL